MKQQHWITGNSFKYSNGTSRNAFILTYQYEHPKESRWFPNILQVSFMQKILLFALFEKKPFEIRILEHISSSQLPCTVHFTNGTPKKMSPKSQTKTLSELPYPQYFWEQFDGKLASSEKWKFGVTELLRSTNI